MTRTIAVFSSARRHGNTGQLMDQIADALQIDVIDLATKRIAAYDYEHRNRSDDFEPLIAHLLDYDKIIFASPVYWYAVTPAMKAFLDRLTDLLDLPELQDKGRQLRRKQAFVVCTSIYDQVPQPFITAFQATFDYLGIPFGGWVHANCEHGYTPGQQERDINAFVATVSGVG